MPTIEIQTNVEVNQTAAQNIKSALGQIITCIPGKTESGLMVLVEDKLRMWFRGTEETPMAIVEVKIFGNQVDKEGAQNMTREVCALLEKELSLNPKDIYVRYLALPDWGCNGSNF